MNEKSKNKIISAVMASAIAFSMIGGIIPSNETEGSSLSIVNVLSASAASYPNINENNYIEFCSPSNIPVYTNSNCNVRGTTERKYNASVGVNDICYIYSIGSSSLKISYPTSSGRKTGYIKIGALMNSASESFNAKASVTVYKANGTKYGSTSKGDLIYKCGNYNGKNIIIYTAKSGRRSFKLGYVNNNDYNKMKGTPDNNSNWCTPLEYGAVYSIMPACASSSCIDISGCGTGNGSNLHLWQSFSNNNQIWKAVKNSDDTYTFFAMNTSEKVIDLSGGQAYNGSNIQLYQSNGSAAQKFYLKNEGNGYYSIHSAVNTNFCIDVNGAANANGTNISIYQSNSTNAQKFKFVKVNTSSSIISYSQYDKRWKDYFYGYSSTGKATIGSSGCGVLSLTNAVANLNGTFIEPSIIADYSVKNGYRVNGQGTSYSLYKSFCNNRGSQYGIKYVGYTNSWENLQSYIQAGNVAIVHVPNHIMTVVKYDFSTKKYLLIDSSPNSSRGTSSGYAWKTKEELKKINVYSDFYIIGKR